MLTKKVRLLEGQHHSLEAAANRRQGDAEMRLAEMSARLEHYEVRWRCNSSACVVNTDVDPWSIMTRALKRRLPGFDR